MPSGFNHACPQREGYHAPARSGQLVGTSLVVFLNILLLLATFATQNCRIPKFAAWLFFAVYLVYVLYEVAGAYDAVPPICFGDICL